MTHERTIQLHERAVLLYDGGCPLCNAAVQFVLRHERRHTLHFAPLDGDFARRALERHPTLRDANSMVWVAPAALDREYVSIRSDAAILVASYIGGAWRLLAFGRIVPRAWRDALYDLVARHRHRLASSTNPACAPLGIARSRFPD